MCALSGLAELPVSPDQRRIVVGVDGSKSGTLALEWAIREARRWPAVVDVVTAWTFPMVEGYAISHSLDDAEKGARQVVEAAMSQVAQDAPNVVVRGETADGEAGPVLVEAAEGADLLVVGSGKIGGFERVLRGSVSAYCSRHATCSVVVVR